MYFVIADKPKEPSNSPIRIKCPPSVPDLNADNSTVCSELLKKHLTSAEVEERKHHRIICRRMVGDVAGMVYDMLQEDTFKRNIS